MSGAEITSIAWGHAKKLSRFLGGGKVERMQQIDFILLASCIGVGLWVLEEAGRNNGNSFAELYLIDSLEWLPQIGIVLVSLIGIWLILVHAAGKK